MACWGSVNGCGGGGGDAVVMILSPDGKDGDIGTRSDCSNLMRTVRCSVRVEWTRSTRRSDVRYTLSSWPNSPRLLRRWNEAYVENRHKMQSTNTAQNDGHTRAAKHSE